MTDWQMKGYEFGACNCAWGCPCQFNALPTLGHCTGGMVVRVDEGHFGDTKLDGVLWGMIAEWPGAIHEGNGKLLIYIDDRTDDRQRKAIVDIVHGKHSAEGTFFNIFSAVCPTKLDPVFQRIDLEWDLDKREARVQMPGVIEMTGEPIRNPVTNDPSYPKLTLPAGFEFKEAEFCSSNIRATGPIKLESDKGHGHFARVHWGPQGYLA